MASIITPKNTTSKWSLL